MSGVIGGLIGSLAGVSPLFLEYFVVGGGGSGSGFQSGVQWGNGGSGGFRQFGEMSISLGSNYSVAVGGGGSGVGNSTNGNAGGNSTFHTFTANGGPRGSLNVATGGFGLGNVNPPTGTNSDFGGIGINYRSIGYGGGGSYGNAASTAPADSGINYGGAWAFEAGGVQVAAAANRGGGGHGATNNGATSGNGGSGIVILAYSSLRIINGGSGLTFNTTTSGGLKITTFTAGNGTISFS
jgi:hypothetical protein